MLIDNVILDFRSDTVTQPTPGMREVMVRAEVGDDVFREDPTVNRLERLVADLFKRDAALMLPSGTMANLIALALHCQRGQEVILERRTHSFAHEVGGAAALVGVMFNPVDSAEGMLTPEQVTAHLRPDDIHEPQSRLLLLENTANLAGGLVMPLSQLQALRVEANRHGMRLHLDGARIWNASVASGVALETYAAQTDTLTCCLSKGLGCPVGSMLVSDRESIEQARRLRKMLGGGMRQAGVLAACGLYALDHHLDRLADDHTLAKDLAQGLARVLDQRYRVQDPQTNIVLVHTDGKKTTEDTVRSWAKLGILTLGLSDTCIRLVTHLNLQSGSAAEAVRRIQQSPEIQEHKHL